MTVIVTKTVVYENSSEYRSTCSPNFGSLYGGS